MFKFKSEKIYKFVYNSGSGYCDTNKTMLLTACDPVQAVKTFNRMVGNKLYNIVEFTEVLHKTAKSEEKEIKNDKTRSEGA